MSYRIFILVFILTVLMPGESFSQACPNWYRDVDGDGFGNAAVVQNSCNSTVSGYALNKLDCNDNSVNNPVWQRFGPGAFSTGAVIKTQIAIGPDGTPFVLYQNYTSDATAGRIGIKKYNGSAWVSLGTDPISTTISMYNPSLAVDSNGVPYMAFLDFDAGANTNNKVSVMKYNTATNAWESVGSRRFSNQTSLNTVVNIALDGNDVPYVAFSSVAMTAVVMKYDGSSWQLVGTEGFADIFGEELTIAIDENNVPYTAMIDNAAGGEVSVMRYNGTAWEFTGGAAFSDNYVDIPPRIVIDPLNVPYVLYYDASSELIMRRFNGTSWEDVGNTSVYSGYTASSIALAIDRFSKPYAVYLDGSISELVVKTLDASNAWVDVAGGTYNAMDLSIAIAPDNIPYISFRDFGNSERAAVLSVVPEPSLPGAPVVSVSKSVTCSAESTNLTIGAASKLNDAAQWVWYSGSCAGTQVGTGTSVAVSPLTTTTYYARAEGSCLSAPGTCSNVAVTVNARPAITTQPVATPQVCDQGNTTLTVLPATGFAYQWYLDKNDGTGWNALTSETANTLNLASVTTAMNAYNYRVDVRNITTNCISTSNTSALTVNPLPVISVQPVASKTICEGTTTSFTVTESGGGSYQWEKYSGTAWATLNGETSATLSIASAPYSLDASEYRVIVSNATTSCRRTSSASTLRVNVTPAVSIQPLPATICSGGTTTFSAGTTGTNLNYAWEEDRGAGFAAVTTGGVYSIGTNGILTITAAPATMTGYKYRIVLSNTGCTSATSNGVATLTVNTSPGVSTQPLSSTICAGGTTTFTAGTTGTNLNYAWEEDRGAGFAAVTSGGVYSIGTNGVLTLTAAPATMNSYKYRVVLSNTGCTSATSNGAATLTVNTAPGVNTQPVSATICSGGNATFTAGTTGTNLNYTWEEDRGTGFATVTTGGVYSIGTNGALTLTAAPAAMNSYKYRVVLSNTGCTSATSDGVATLTINTAPAVNTQPVSSTICSGGNATFTAVTTGSNLNYAWEEDRGAGFAAVTTGGVYSVDTNGALTLTAAPATMNSYKYRVVLSNTGCTSATSNGAATLTVNTAPGVSTQPLSSTICAGGTTTFTAGTTGTNLNYTWEEDRGTGFATVTTGGVYSIGTNGVLTLTAAPATMSGYKYRVVLSNTGCTSATSDGVATLTINIAPAVNTQPVSSTICSGGNAVFTAGTTGSNLNYAWEEDRGTGFTAVTTGGVYSIGTNGALTLTAAPATMTGYKYRVVLSNTGCTSVTSSGTATLIVNTAAGITADPVDATVCATHSATFNATASGTNLSYQWQQDDGSGWSDLAGKTLPTLQLTNVATSQNGYQYRLVVSNTGCAAVNSAASVLTVNTQPAITTNPLSTIVCVGSEAVFNVATDVPGESYQWQVNDGSGWTNTGSSVSDPQLTLTGVAATLNTNEYRVVVSNAGCTPATSTAAVLTVNASSGIIDQPVDRTTCENTGASFTVNATGSNLGYQWQSNNGAGWNDLAGENNASFALTSVDPNMNENQYRVKITTTGCPDILSTAAVLYVNSMPVVTLQPSSTVICEGRDTGFQATATGQDLTLQWQVNDGSGWTDLPAATEASLLLTGVTSDMNGYEYRLVVSTTGCAPEMSAAATLTVNTDPGTEGCDALPLLISQGVSPNGDDKLDYWLIQGIEEYPGNMVKLYNIWGDLIFERDNYNNQTNAWRGEANRGATVGGQRAPDGTYFYLINLGNGRPALRGFVVLKR